MWHPYITNSIGPIWKFWTTLHLIDPLDSVSLTFLCEWLSWNSFVWETGTFQCSYYLFGYRDECILLFKKRYGRNVVNTKRCSFYQVDLDTNVYSYYWISKERQYNLKKLSSKLSTILLACLLKEQAYKVKIKCK